uniref:Uncharacterized protein n=1 Tax=Panagrolaimus sp. PS1159 TaxID=55785 RepID=A0AC35FA24_9BILA
MYRHIKTKRNVEEEIALLRALGKRKEGPDLSLEKGKSFKVDSAKIYFVTEYSEKEGYSKIVNINTGKILFIDDKLPVGSICHSYQRYGDDPVRYFYDLFCSELLPQEVEVSSFKGFALHLCNCKVIQFLVDGVVHLEHKDFRLHIKNVLQVSERPLSLKEYIPENADQGYLDCWIIPVETDRKDFCEWVILPSSVPSKKCYLYPKRFEKIQDMFSGKFVGIGTVVGIGKIAIRQGTCKYCRFVNCPKEYVLGSTYACVYDGGEISGNKVKFLVFSKPLKLQRRYMETFVTPGGSVLIKTIVGKPSLTGRIVKLQPLKDQSFHPGKGPTIRLPAFNYSYHPFFGKIIFSNKMLWSAPTMKVIIGGTLNSTCKLLSSAGSDTSYMYFHILAFHDGVQYWRVPDVPDDLYDSKNFLIQNGVKMWGNPSDPTSELHPPQVLQPCIMEGRFLCNELIKYPEYIETYVRDSETDKYDEDEKFVRHPSSQLRKER